MQKKSTMSANNKQESRLGKGLSALLGDIQTIGPERDRKSVV